MTGASRTRPHVNNAAPNKQLLSQLMRRVEAIEVKPHSGSQSKRPICLIFDRSATFALLILNPRVDSVSLAGFPCRRPPSRPSSFSYDVARRASVPEGITVRTK